MNICIFQLAVMSARDLVGSQVGFNSGVFYMTD